jgi:cation diffusion facilitator family transporter
MHTDSIETFRHSHIFLGEHHRRNERRTWGVIVLCGCMMVAEIGGGLLFGSMALIADGLHMSTHTAALLIAALAYSFARWHLNDERFVFGTGKFGDLAGFSSAITLAMIALLIGWESIDRFLHPVAIAFNQAIPIAAVGLGVNLVSAWLLRDDHDHHHDQHHRDHKHHHHSQPDEHAAGAQRDLNLRSAYVHVLADAAVSVLAIVGLLAARHLGWVWMDPLMGIVGAAVIANWSWGLIRASGAVLLDMRSDTPLMAAMRERLEVEGDRLADLHLWRVGPGHNAAVISIVADEPHPPAVYKERLKGLESLSHVTVEVQRCP